jgi:hypothetical protein
MATEFTVILENRPGTLARLGTVLGDARVNIEAIHGNAREKSAIVQFVPDDQDKAAHALDTAGIAYSGRGPIGVEKRNGAFFRFVGSG